MLSRMPTTPPDLHQCVHARRFPTLAAGHCPGLQHVVPVSSAPVRSSAETVHLIFHAWQSGQPVGKNAIFDQLCAFFAVDAANRK
jgi:hypothetical protein